MTTKGLNGALLQNRINGKGIPAIVVQLSAAGANHAERYEFQREFVGAQTPLVDELNNPALWYNELHLRRPGAKIYSEAFADYLIQRVQAGEL